MTGEEREHPERLSRAWSVMFAVIGLYEIAGCSDVLFDLDRHVTTFYGSDKLISGPIAMFYAELFWLVILILGVGYLIVAWDPTRNRGILWLGIMIRLSFVAGVVSYWAQELTTPLVLVVAGVDVIFVGLFLWFLYRTREFGWV